MRRAALLALLALLAVAGAAYLRSGDGAVRYTGFVEGEERVLRSEVSARILEVLHGEGDAVPAAAVVARLDDRDVRSRLESKAREIAVLDADIQAQRERIRLVEGTWERDVAARRAELRQAEAAAALAERTFERERDLAQSGASTAQLLDDARARRDQARGALDRARELLARAEAEAAGVMLARQELASLRARRALAEAERAELEVTQGKYTIRAPDVPTVVQTRLAWPGELAQPGTAILAVLDPADKYVQVYVPAADLARFRVGRRVAVELDGAPGRRLPGEVTFVADAASFTPEKIETRSDRLGQVYRAKVRLLEGAERAPAGAEGDVWLLDDEPARDAAERR